MTTSGSHLHGNQNTHPIHGIQNSIFNIYYFLNYIITLLCPLQSGTIR